MCNKTRHLNNGETIHQEAEFFAQPLAIFIRFLKRILVKFGVDCYETESNDT